MSKKIVRILLAIVVITAAVIIIFPDGKGGEPAKADAVPAATVSDRIN